MFVVESPPRRRFQWRVLVVLVSLYLLGNLSGVPLLRRMDAPIEPLWLWAVVTAFSALLLAFCLVVQNRTGLGAPFLEGRLPWRDFSRWLRSGLAVTAVMLAAGAPLSMLANRNADADTYPFGWELLPASVKAGVTEELGYRFFVISLLVWLGGLLRRNREDRPGRSVYWLAILIAALLFGWAHVAARLSNPAIGPADFALLMTVSSLVGFGFGWLLWTLGIEWAMFAHFAYDAFVSMILVPVYLSRSPVAWGTLVATLIVAFVVSWRFLRRK